MSNLRFTLPLHTDHGTMVLALNFNGDLHFTPASKNILVSKGGEGTTSFPRQHDAISSSYASGDFHEKAKSSQAVAWFQLQEEGKLRDRVMQLSADICNITNFCRASAYLSQTARYHTKFLWRGQMYRGFAVSRESLCQDCFQHCSHIRTCLPNCSGFTSKSIKASQLWITQRYLTQRHVFYKEGFTPEVL